MLSLDDSLSDAEQKQMNMLGKQLRGSLINLLSAIFEDDIHQVDDANEQLRIVNQHLSDVNNILNKVADTVATVTQLVKTLDDLLLLAAKFV